LPKLRKRSDPDPISSTKVHIAKEKLYIDGVTVPCTQFGPDGGKPLVIVHGWAGWWETFTEEILLKEAYRAGIRVLALDSPSWDPEAVENSYEKFRGIIREVVNRTPVERVSICGQSAGSLIAALFALHYPERTEKLILASPPATIVNGRRGRKITKDTIAVIRGNPFLFKLANRVQKGRLYNLVGARIALQNFDWKLFETHIYPAALQCDLRVALLNNESALSFDWENIYPRISAPTAIITGDGDPVSRVSDCEKLCHLLPDARLFVIPHARHGIMMEKPHEFAKLIVDFVAD